MQIVRDAKKVQNLMIVIFGQSPVYGYLNTVQEYNFGTREWRIIHTHGYPVKGGYGELKIKYIKSPYKVGAKRAFFYDLKEIFMVEDFPPLLIFPLRYVFALNCRTFISL